MAVVRCAVIVPIRAWLWLRFLAGKQSPSQYMVGVVLRHLNTTPGVDLSRNPDLSEEAQHGSEES